MNDQPFGKIAKPAQRALANAGIKTLEQLTEWCESDLMKLHGIGKNGLLVLKSAMTEKGIVFKFNG